MLFQKKNKATWQKVALSLCCVIDKIALMLQEEKLSPLEEIVRECIWSILREKSVSMIATVSADFKLVNRCS